MAAKPAAPPPPYAELQCTTNFSFLRGGSHPKELVTQAKALGHVAIGVADRNTLAGVVRAHAQAKKEGLRLLVGARLDTTDGFSCLCYPTDRAAYGRLCKLLTKGKLDADKGDCRFSFADMLEYVEGQVLIALPPDDLQDTAAFETRLLALRERVPGDLWLAIHHLYRGEDRTRCLAIARLGARLKVPLVATNDVHYHHPDRRPLQDVVTCIREKCRIEEAGFRLLANAERHLKPADEMARLFAAFPEALAAISTIVDRCRFSLDELKYNYPHEPVPPGISAQAHLERLTWEGAERIYRGNIPEKVVAALRKELSLIEDLDYPHYFLTVHDIVAFARSQGILCQGRGSAANSAVCYCLGVTAIDPATNDLLIERFLSKERKEPPDIDIDFEHERREEVMQYIYRRYGRRRAAIAATVISYRPRSAVREVGKVMGLSEDVTTALASTVWGSWGKDMPESQVKEAGLDISDPHLKRTIELTEELIEFPRHLSQHVGGFVLTEDPLEEIVPIGNAAMDERTFIEWDKDDIDELNILKVDVLALGMLTCIAKCFALLSAHYGPPETCIPEWSRRPLRQLPSSFPPAPLPPSSPLRIDRPPIHRHSCARHRNPYRSAIGTGALSTASPRDGGIGIDPCDRHRGDEVSVRQPLADLTPCGGDARQGRGGCGGAAFAGADDSGEAAFPPLSPSVTSPPQGGRLVDAASLRQSPSSFPPAPSPPSSASPTSRPPIRRHFCARHRNPSRSAIDTEALSTASPGSGGIGIDLCDRHRGDEVSVRQPLADLTPCGGDARQGRGELKRFQEKWKPVFRPETRQNKGIDLFCDSRKRGSDLGQEWLLTVIPQDDEKTYDMLCRADAIGVFQVESRAQLNMLPRLKPKKLYDLVIEVAIVRPGPIQGDMVHPYLRRRDGLEKVEYPSPAPDKGDKDELKAILDRTLGVPLFQEQAMQIAMDAAEFSGDEANQLRRAMATFRHAGTIHELEERMVSRMIARGYDTDFAKRCFDQIKGFGEYGFPESHAASFALIVYASAWLKCHYPDVFCAALLNSQPMGFYAPAQIVRDAREHGIEVRPVDLNDSFWDNTLEWREDGSHAVRLGFRQVDGLSETVMKAFTARRAAHPPLRTLEEARRRTGLTLAVLEKLAAVDGFRSLGLDRRQGLWAVRGLMSEKQLPLFEAAETDAAGADQPATLPAMRLSEHVVADYQTQRLSLKAHPMGFLRPRYRERRILSSADLKEMRQDQWVEIAGVVLVRQQPGTAKGVIFMTIEDETGVANIVVWSKVMAAYRKVVMRARLVLVRGVVQRTEDIIHVVARELIDLSGDLALLSEDVMPVTQSRADEARHPQRDDPRGTSKRGAEDRHTQHMRHPRNVRIIPKSRDFH